MAFPKEIVAPTMTLYKNMKSIVCLPDEDINFDFDVGVFKADIWALYMIIVCLDDVHRTIKMALYWKEVDHIPQKP